MVARRTVAWLFSRVTNRTVHNRAGFNLESLPGEKKLLSYGPKFIPSLSRHEERRSVFRKAFIDATKARQTLFNILAERSRLAREEESDNSDIKRPYHFLALRKIKQRQQQLPPLLQGSAIQNWKRFPQLQQLRIAFAETIVDFQRAVNSLIHQARELQVSERKTKRVLDSNCSIGERRNLGKLLASNDVVVLLADKNMGYSVVSNEWFQQALAEIFLDEERYERFSPENGEKLLALAQRQFDEELTKLSFGGGSNYSSRRLWNDAVNHKLRSSIYPTRACSIKPLDKVHKPRPQLRQVIQAHRSPFQPFAKWFAALLHPIVVAFVPSWLQDSSMLLAQLINLKLDPNKGYTFVTADAVNLYGDLPLDRVNTALNWALAQLTRAKVLLPEQVKTIKNMAGIANNNNFVEFAGFWLRQKKGIAMGRADSVDLANLTLGHVETMHRPDALLFARFIDDVAAILECNEEEARRRMETYFSATGVKWNANYIYFPSNTPVQLTTPANAAAVFLDIKFWRSGGKDVFTSLHVKETSLGLYIPPTSWHAKHVHSAWIVAELRRFIRSCSSQFEFLAHAKRFYWLLRARGYSREFLMPLFSLRHHWTEERNRALTWLSKRASRPDFSTIISDADPYAGSRQKSTVEIFIPIRYTPTMGRLAPSRFISNFTKAAREQILIATHRWKKPVNITFRTAWCNLPSLASTVDKALQDRLRGLDFRPNRNQRGVDSDPEPEKTERFFDSTI